MTDPRQTPIESPFGYRSTAQEVAQASDVSGKTVVITGGYAGLGLETTKALVHAGADVIVTGRSMDKARLALDGLNVRTVQLDLMEPDSIADGAEQLHKEASSGIDILINNAGIMATPLRRNSKGWESQFATNHLGHFALFARISELLLKRSGARVVTLSSLGHRITGVELEDWNYETGPYDKWQSYGRTKSANALFALELNTRYEARGLQAYSLHPGGIATELQRDLEEEELRAFGWINEAGELHPSFKTPEQGASTTVWAATSPLLDNRGGVYCEDCNIARPETSKDTTDGVYPWVRDPEIAGQLWTLSEEITGLKTA